MPGSPEGIMTSVVSSFGLAAWAGGLTRKPVVARQTRAVRNGAAGISNSLSSCGLTWAAPAFMAAGKKLADRGRFIERNVPERSGDRSASGKRLKTRLSLRLRRLSGGPAFHILCATERA